VSDWQSDYHAWQDGAAEVRARADRTRRMIIDRARGIALEAGTSTECVFLHAHNAAVAKHYGRPWPNVDYSKVRLILRLERLSWEPHRLADRINGRTFEDLRRRAGMVAR